MTNQSVILKEKENQMFVSMKIMDMYKNITENYDISRTSKDIFESISCFIFQNNTLKFQEEHITMVII